MPGADTGVLGQAILWALIPVAMMAIGVAVASWRPPGERMRSAIQHFAAGVVFSVISVELLPDLRALHSGILEIGGGFALGVVLMLVVERLAGADEGAEAGDEARGGAFSMLVPVGIDLILDGFLVGIAFAAGATEGTLLSIALAFELLSLGLALHIEMTAAGASRHAAALIPIGLALVTLVGGTAAGAAILANAAPPVMATVLSFGSAALLFLVTEELLVEAHKVAESAWATSLFFAGFLLLFLLGTLH